MIENGRNFERSRSFSKLTKQRKGLSCFDPPLMSFDQFATIRLLSSFSSLLGLTVLECSLAQPHGTPRGRFK